MLIGHAVTGIEENHFCFLLVGESDALEASQLRAYVVEGSVFGKSDVLLGYSECVHAIFAECFAVVDSEIHGRNTI